MKMLMIVARDFILDELENLLCDSGITGYTILEEVAGKGKAGRVRKAIVYGETNVVVFAVCSSAHVDKAVDALKKFVTARADALHGHPIPLKVFCHPCEELI